MAGLACLVYPDLPTVAVHRDLKAHERKEAIQDTKNGTAMIVIIVKMLVEGFDHPPV